MRVKFTPAAKDQLSDAVAYIRRERPSAAARFAERARKNLTRLELYPVSGRRVPEFPDSSIREVVIDSYRYFYEVLDDTVWILAVWHQAQQPAEPT